MMRYFFDRKLRAAKEREEQEPGSLEIFLVTEQELRSRGGTGVRHEGLLRSMESLRYCKAETFGDCAVGTLSAPDRDHPAGKRREFGYCLTKERCVLVDNEGWLSPLMIRLEEREYEERTGAGVFFAGLLNEIIRDDAIRLQRKEELLMEAEESLVKGRAFPGQFPEKLQAWRKELMILHSYYEQLADMGADLQENTEEIFSLEERAALARFAARAYRLHGHVEMLQEYSAQLREMYQSKLDLEQNRIMSMLTVVTTIFLPLSILVGWYGMNFVHMPELQWRYGYLGVILLSAAMVTGEILYFRKKKMLK